MRSGTLPCVITSSHQRLCVCVCVCASGDLKLADDHVGRLTDSLAGFSKYISENVMSFLNDCNEPDDLPPDLSRADLHDGNKACKGASIASLLIVLSHTTIPLHRVYLLSMSADLPQLEEKQQGQICCRMHDRERQSATQNGLAHNMDVLFDDMYLIQRVFDRMTAEKSHFRCTVCQTVDAADDKLWGSTLSNPKLCQSSDEASNEATADDTHNMCSSRLLSLDATASASLCQSIHHLRLTTSARTQRFP